METKITVESRVTFEEVFNGDSEEDKVMQKAAEKFCNSDSHYFNLDFTRFVIDEELCFYLFLLIAGNLLKKEVIQGVVLGPVYCILYHDDPKKFFAWYDEENMVASINPAPEVN